MPGAEHVSSRRVRPWWIRHVCTSSARWGCSSTLSITYFVYFTISNKGAQGRPVSLQGGTDRGIVGFIALHCKGKIGRSHPVILSGASVTEPPPLVILSEAEGRAKNLLPQANRKGEIVGGGLSGGIARGKSTQNRGKMAVPAPTLSRRVDILLHEVMIIQNYISVLPRVSRKSPTPWRTQPWPWPLFPLRQMMRRMML